MDIVYNPPCSLSAPLSGLLEEKPVLLIQFSNELGVSVRRPVGIDQAIRKSKVGTSSAGSANAFDMESFAKLMANEYAMANNPYNAQKGQEMTEVLRIKKQELEPKAAELEIQRLKNHQRDEALYLSTTDEGVKAILRQRLFG
nr:hypothetical protein [Tanacetum cinerariifolium]